ncbi:hypothetical protein DNTS_030307 [Danionella cerebrum]|uniref:Uncharacterized protein n=1 Tax=Danionella cerebrum TaxID=2873325 RepID=A0A553RJX3_9TELE|nr:hypothetical protein DNTS_030307 [Danionella translucida]
MLPFVLQKHGLALAFLEKRQMPRQPVSQHWVKPLTPRAPAVEPRAGVLLLGVLDNNIALGECQRPLGRGGGDGLRKKRRRTLSSPIVTYSIPPGIAQAEDRRALLLNNYSRGTSEWHTQLEQVHGVCQVDLAVGKANNDRSRRTMWYLVPVPALPA